MRTIFTGVLVLGSALLAGCINTYVKSYTDSDFANKHISKIVIDLSGISPTDRDDFETPLISEFKDAGIDAVTITSVLKPTRDYTPVQTLMAINDASYDSILTMQVTGDKSQSNYVGSIANTNVNAYSYGNQVNATGTSYSTPLIVARGVTTFHVTIFDSKTGRKVWVGDLTSKAQGTAFVGHADRIAASAVSALIDKLREDGKI